MPSRCRKKTQARPAPRCAASASPGARSCASGARNAARRGGAPLSTIRPRLSRHQARARGFLASELSRPAIQRSERSRPPDRGGGSRQGPLERSPRSRDSPRARSQPSTPPARPGLGRQVPRARSLDAARGTSCPGLCSDEHTGTELDPCSSAAWFSGWGRRPTPMPSGAPPVAVARTWLARIGWLRHGAIDTAERPKGS